MNVLVDDGVVLGVDDYAGMVMMMMVVVTDRGRHGRDAVADGRQCLVRSRDHVLFFVAGCGHELLHGHGRRVTAAAGLMSGHHPVALVGTGTTGVRAERPSARLIV